MSGAIGTHLAPGGAAFAKQSFALAEVKSLRHSDAEFEALYEEVLKGIVSNVKTQPGGFKATSGLVLPYYLNLSTNFMDPVVAPKLVRLLSNTILHVLIPRLNPQPGERFVMVGMEVAGGMLISQIAAAGNTELMKYFDFVYMRKERKSTGTAQQLEAKKEYTARTHESPRVRAVWVDDCMSTGGSLCQGITTLLEDYNIEVVECLYVVDRSVDRQGLDDSKQKLADKRFVEGVTRIGTLMDLTEVDGLVHH